MAVTFLGRSGAACAALDDALRAKLRALHVPPGTRTVWMRDEKVRLKPPSRVADKGAARSDAPTRRRVVKLEA